MIQLVRFESDTEFPKQVKVGIFTFFFFFFIQVNVIILMVIGYQTHWVQFIQMKHVT